MAKRSSLGKNLDALLGQIQTIQAASQEKSEHELVHLPIEYLTRGQYQPRRDFPAESLQELADSIRAQGIIQPLIVRHIGQQRYEIIAGERRWRAAQLAGLTQAPAIVRNISDEATLAVALIENIQRENLSPIDEATALCRFQKEFGLTHEAIAQMIGKSRAAVTNLIRLLQLEPAVKKFLERQQLSFGHAKVLLALSGSSQIQAAQAIIANNLTVRATEQMVLRLQKPTPSKHKKIDLPDIKRLENQLAEQLGAKVIIQQNANGRGKVVIEYYSFDELEGILEKVGGNGSMQ
jgi:ParB family chromosome partitioning protein